MDRNSLSHKTLLLIRVPFVPDTFESPEEDNMATYEIHGVLIAVDNAGVYKDSLPGRVVFLKVGPSLLDQPEWYSGLTDGYGFFAFQRGLPVAHNRLELGVRTSGGRILRIVANAVASDTTDHVLTIPQIQIDEDDAFGPWVMLNKGVAQRRATGSVTFLMDQDAFRYAAAMIRRGYGHPGVPTVLHRAQDI